MPHILVIDDDPTFRSVLRAALEIEGHEVVEASNGAEGIKLFKKQKFDITLCDIFMPDKEGLETILELKRDFPDIKLIAMSGAFTAGELDPLAVAIKFGAKKVLKKPFEIEVLQEAINDLLTIS